MTETEARIISKISQNKSLLIHYAEKEDWVKVAQLADELKTLRERRISILESR